MASEDATTYEVRRAMCRMHHSFGDCFFSTPPPQNPLAQCIHPAQREVLIERIFLGESMGGVLLLVMVPRMHADLGVDVFETDSHRHFFDASTRSVCHTHKKAAVK